MEKEIKEIKEYLEIINKKIEKLESNYNNNKKYAKNKDGFHKNKDSLLIYFLIAFVLSNFLFLLIAKLIEQKCI